MIGPASETFDIAVSGGTPGADANTYLFFSSVVAFGAFVMPSLGVKRIQFAVKNSQAFTLNAYESTNGGVTWDLYDTRAVAASGAGVVAGPFDYLVDSFKDWKLEGVNGGVAQATWRPVMTGVCGDRSQGA